MMFPGTSSGLCAAVRDVAVAFQAADIAGGARFQGHITFIGISATVGAASSAAAGASRARRTPAWGSATVGAHENRIGWRPTSAVPNDPGFEGGDGLPRAPRVEAAGDRAGVVERALAGHGEGDDGVSAEPEAGGSVVDAHALGPGLVEAAVGGGPDQKAEAEPAAAVAVAAGRVDVLDEGGGEHEGSNFHFSFLVRLQGRVEKQCAPVMRGTPKSVVYQKVKGLHGLS